MKALGIDYGRAKIGLAIAEFSPDYIGLAEPLKVIRVSGFEDALKKTEQEIEKEKPDAIIVGVSENKMGEEQIKFSKTLSLTISLPIETQDESLSTQDAQDMAIAAGIPMEKRRKMEDAFAASIMLQSWLDSNSSR